MTDTERNRLEAKCAIIQINLGVSKARWKKVCGSESLFDLIAAEKAESARLAIPAKKYPIGIIVGTQNNKASFNQGWNACINYLTNQQTNEDKEI